MKIFKIVKFNILFYLKQKVGLWEEDNLYDTHDIVRVLLKGNNQNDPYEAALMEADKEAIQKEQKIEDEPGK